MRFNFLNFVFIFILLPFSASSQNGFIRGAVLDDANNESLPGVTIYIEGSTFGTITDLDGKFNLNASPGIYTLRVSFVSFETLIINDLEVKPGEVTLLDNLRLKTATIGINEVTVTARMVRNTENSMLVIKRKSPNVLDGITSDSFRKIGDSDAASSMKRVPGVSVEGGKYVYVRGLGDRYTKTILNGVDIPGLDPDRNTIQMDIFPTNNATLPADFTGGVIDIGTKDFPEEKKVSISLSAGYNPSMHFNKNYLSYEGGAFDFLGFDDGTRDIPATTNIPFFSEVVANPNGEKGVRYKQILESFNPALSAMKQQSLMDFGLGLSVGNQIPKEKVTLGYHVALSYKNNTEYYEMAEFGRYGLTDNPDNYEMNAREFQSGDYGSNNVLLSGLAGFAIKTRSSKFSLDLLHLQNGESKAGIFNYRNADQGAIFEGFQHNLEYSERSLSNAMISGKHSIGDRNWDVEWKLSPTLSRMNDPDVRFTRYENREGTYSIGTEVGFPERIWRELKETNISGILHVTRNFKWREEAVKLQFGGAYTHKDRNFDIMSYALNIRGVTLTGDPDELFYPENLWPLNNNLSRGTTFEAPFYPTNPNQFDATVTNAGGYVNTEISPLKRFKAVIGLRIENYTQYYTGQDQLGANVLNNEKVIDALDLFPAVNLIYSLNEKQNLRLSYAKTIARPSFKELSYAEIFDAITGRTFIGGLFRDANDLAGVEYWDGKLVGTDIHNFDIRWELFPSSGQTVSLSGFYKRFLKPIELVQFATLAGAYQPRNVGNGTLLGTELEIRQKLDFISPSLKAFSISGNFSVTRSRIKLSKTEYESRLENARTGQSVDEYRNMAGQAPYLLNAGLAYEGEEKGFLNGLDAGLYYNVQGQTLQYVGIVDRPDIYSKPFHGLNFNANKRFGKAQRMQAGLKISNILNDTKEAVFNSYRSTETYFSRLNPGTSFQMRFSFDLF
jgi:hypothetical protein